MNKLISFKDMFIKNGSNVVLRRSDSIDNSGDLVWQLVVALFCAWLIVYMMVVNGINVIILSII